jgi:large subunit ribosomal protein L4
MPAKKEVLKTSDKQGIKPVAKQVVHSRSTGASAPLFSLDGKAVGSMALPKEVFAAEINESLINQALRVYLNNKKGHYSNTKTRGEVEGSTRKIFKQKGTGRARHGSIRANIFVGGGIALGPKSRNVTLELPQKMKRLALISALSKKAKEGNIKGLSGLEISKGKTKEFANFLKLVESRSALFVIDGKESTIQRATKNLGKVRTLSVLEMNTLEVLKYQTLILTKEAVSALETRFKKVEK